MGDAGVAAKVGGDLPGAAGHFGDNRGMSNGIFSARALGVVPTAQYPQYQQPSNQLSGTQAALLLGGIGVFMAAVIALQFYRASKGLEDTYVVRDDWGGHHHHDHGGLSISFGRNARRGRRSRRRSRRSHRRSRR